MGVAATTTGATMSAIQESLALLSVKLGRIAERQDNMLADMKKTTAALMPIATTTPMFVPNGVLEQPAVKPSSPSLLSALQVVGAGAPPAKAIPAPSMPTRCSTLGSCINGSSNHAVVAFPTSGTTHQPAVTLINAKNNMLQGVGEAGMNDVEANIGARDSETHSTSKQQLMLSEESLADVSHTVEPLVEDSAEVLTHVEYLSLFSELDVDSVDEVFTDVGGFSLFLELDLDSTHKMSKDMALDEELADTILTQVDIIHAPIFWLPYAKNRVKLSLPWDPGKQDGIVISPTGCIQLVILRTQMKQRKTIVTFLVQAGRGSALCAQLNFHKGTIGHVWHLFRTMRHLIDITRPWDPGTSWFGASPLRMIICLKWLFGGLKYIPDELYTEEVILVLQYAWSQDFSVGVEQKRDYCSICSLHRVCSAEIIKGCNALIWLQRQRNLLFYFWLDTQLCNLSGSANMFFTALSLTKACIIKHVTSFLSTIKFSCDGKLRTPVLVYDGIFFSYNCNGPLLPSPCAHCYSDKSAQSSCTSWS